jgi:flagellar hook-associated protein 2
MATYSSLGVGAGLDLQTLLSKLMDAERTPVRQLESRIAATNTKISSYGTLQSKLDGLKAASDTLKFESSLVAKTATSTDSSVATATASASALNGSYTLEVSQLASTQKSFSAAFNANQTFGSGTLTFSINGSPTTAIDITGSDNTLQGIGAQINAANVGVKATVIASSDGSQRMVFTSDKTGADQSFTLSSSIPAVAPFGGGTAVSLGDFDETTDGLARKVASDAMVKIDGISVSSSSNTFEAALPGVSFTVSKASTVDTPAISTLTIGNNDEKIVAAVQAFVDAYNAVSTNVTQNTGYDSVKKAGKAFSGDFAVRSVMDDLRNARSTEPAGVSSSVFKTLNDLGISVQQSGALSLDSTKLKEKLAAASGDVIKTLNAYGDAFSSSLSGTLSTGGAFASRVDGLNSSVQRYQDSITALEVRLAQTERRYRAQFTALDKYVSAMQSTGSYLSQQLSSLQKSS